MRKASTSLLIAAALVITSVATSASGQERERQRSAPPTPTRGSSGPSSASGSSNTPAPTQDRRDQRPTERRDTPPATSQAPRNDTRSFYGPSRNIEVRPNDSRNAAPQRQAVPAPRER